jgi:hypothetical protein
MNGHEDSPMKRCLPWFRLPLAALPLLAGCTHFPADSTSRYSYVPVGSHDGSAVPRTHYILWPDACRSDEPPTDPPLGNGPPPGCANDYNLLHMTEREGDLVRGRRLGAAPAAPSARAAAKYIYGGEGPMGAGLSEPGGLVSPTSDDHNQTPAGGKPASSGATTAQR